MRPSSKTRQSKRPSSRSKKASPGTSSSSSSSDDDDSADPEDAPVVVGTSGFHRDDDGPVVVDTRNGAGSSIKINRKLYGGGSTRDGEDDGHEDHDKSMKDKIAEAKAARRAMKFAGLETFGRTGINTAGVDDEMVFGGEGFGRRHMENDPQRPFGAKIINGVVARSNPAAPLPSTSDTLTELGTARDGRSRARLLLSQVRVTARAQSDKRKQERNEVEATAEELKGLQRRLKVSLSTQLILEEFDSFTKKLSHALEAKTVGVAEAEQMKRSMEAAYCQGSEKPLDEEEERKDATKGRKGDGTTEDDDKDGSKKESANGKAEPQTSASAPAAPSVLKRGEHPASSLDEEADVFFGKGEDDESRSSTRSSRIQKFHSTFQRDRLKFKRACEKQFSGQIPTAAEVFQQFHLVRDTAPHLYRVHLKKHLVEALSLSVRVEMLDWDPLKLLGEPSSGSFTGVEVGPSAQPTPSSSPSSTTRVQDLPWYQAFLGFARELDTPSASEVLLPVFHKVVWPNLEHYFLRCWNPCVAAMIGTMSTTTTSSRSSPRSMQNERGEAAFLGIISFLREVYDATAHSAEEQQKLWAEVIETLIVRFLRRAEHFLQSDGYKRQVEEYESTNSSPSPPPPPLSTLLICVLTVAAGWFRAFHISEDSYSVVSFVLRSFIKTHDQQKETKTVTTLETACHLFERYPTALRDSVLRPAFSKKLRQILQPLVMATPSCQRSAELRTKLASLLGE
ncbi:unnamed protein product [Amoebophrya sp. A25]|nr:unnamed protein product [Amoebophrya sp. A25]|eukprot:GSA25T00020335001.1